MKLLIIFLPAVIIAIFSCNQVSFKNDHSIELIDSVDFRRSYASIMFDTTADPDLYTRKPNFLGTIDVELQNKLNKLGFMSNDSIVTSSFTSVENSHFIQNRVGDSFHLFYRWDSAQGKRFLHFKNQDINDSMELPTPLFYQIAFADFIPGGYPEMFLLENIYIMNGDNYYLKIYKVQQ